MEAQGRESRGMRIAVDYLVASHMALAKQREGIVLTQGSAMDIIRYYLWSVWRCSYVFMKWIY
jgi:hypothetical protein